MKPTRCDREALAGLATGALAPHEERATRDHVASCAACRAQLVELSRLHRALVSSAHDLPATALSERTHRRIATAISASDPADRHPLRVGFLFLLRPALVAAALTVVALNLDRLLPQHPDPALPPVASPTLADTSPVVGSDSGSPSQLGTLRRALHRSDEAFEQALTPRTAGTGKAPATEFRLGTDPLMARF